MADVVLEKKKGSPKWEETRDGHRITVEYNIYVFSPMEAKLYLPQRGDGYLDEDGFSDSAKVSSVSCEPISTDPTDPLCFAEVVWEYSDNNSGGGATGTEKGWAIETTPSTEHITHTSKLGDTNSWTVDGGGAQLGSAIGHNGDPTEVPEGLDVQSPYSTVRVWKYFNPSLITNAFIKSLEAQRRTTNSSAYTVGRRTYEIGELLYLSFDISQTASTNPGRSILAATTPVRVEWTFLARSNETGLEFTVYGDPVARPGHPRTNAVTIDKKGWEYLEKTDGLVRDLSQAVMNDRVLKALVAVKKHKVYPSSEFSLLQASL